MRNERTKGLNVLKGVLTFSAEKANSYLVNPELTVMAHATSGGEGISDKRKVKGKKVGRSGSSHKLAGDVGPHRQRVRRRGKEEAMTLRT